jgi:hypothetical protein
VAEVVEMEFLMFLMLVVVVPVALEPAPVCQLQQQPIT